MISADKRSKHLIKENTSAPALAIVSKALNSEFVELGLSSFKNKKFKKKLKLSAVQAIYRLALHLL